MPVKAFTAWYSPDEVNTCVIQTVPGIRTLDDARVLLDDPQGLDMVETALRTVPGDGGFGVRRGYLWMLVGHEDTVKPRTHGAAVADPPRR